MTKSIAKLS